MFIVSILTPYWVVNTATSIQLLQGIFELCLITSSSGYNVRSCTYILDYPIQIRAGIYTK